MFIINNFYLEWITSQFPSSRKLVLYLGATQIQIVKRGAFRLTL
jgi:hypothetical protein